MGLNEYFSTYLLVVPGGYISGTPLAGTATFSGTTLVAMGATPGTYVWTWGSGNTADSLTLLIGASAEVPEPGTLFLVGGVLLGSMALKGALRVRRSRQRDLARASKDFR
jgi:hypothetical protein